MWFLNIWRGIDMTKADRIRTLYAAGKDSKEIAELVGCHPDYVRVAARQRVGGKSRPCDTLHARAESEFKKKYGDYEAARKAGREASAKGLSYHAAYSLTLLHTAKKNSRVLETA